MRQPHCKLLLAFAFLLFTLPAFAAETRGVKRVEIKTQTGESVGLYEESHALVIGVSAYEHWPKLPGVKRDVTDVAAALGKNGFSVQTVLDPDQDMLDDAFESFIEQHGGNPENRLLFYFAGHGHTVQPKFGGEPLGYLVPTDAPVPTLGKREQRRFKRVAMGMQRIEEYALNIDAKHALFLFDACFSGSLFALSRAIPESISYKTTKPVRQFITSGSAEETVPDQSIFRSQFVAALEGEADANGDGYLSGTELGEFLQDSVVNYSKGAQHPQYGKIRNPNLDKGDFVFALPKTAREPEPSSTAAAPVSATPSTSSPSEFRADEEAWKDIKNSNDPDDFRFFLEEFPASPLAKTAKFKLRRLERKQVKAEQQQLAEAKRKVAEEQKQQLAEEAKQEEERNRIEQEQRRIAEAKRKAEAERKRQEELAALKQKQQPAGEWTEPITGMRFVTIPGGSFVIGDQFGEGEDREQNNRKFTVRLFQLGATEVTQGEWQKIMGNNPSRFRSDDRPVENVSWFDVQKFIKKLNKRHGGRYTFRLPTEAEWEYACREGGRKVRYCNGKNEASRLEIHYGRSKTSPVASYSPNSLGLYDMSGNVWEWTCSEYNIFYDGSEEHCSDQADDYGFRGGSLGSRAWLMRAAFRRGHEPPDYRLHLLGFRLARD